jgi:hypothetical protein
MANGLSVADEFRDVDLGDRRLRRRLTGIVEKLEAEPSTTFPQVMNVAELEGLYRFLGNDRVSLKSILAPHVRATIERVAAHETVLVVHDTTQFKFGGEREGLGNRTKDSTSFFGHFSLAVAADGTRDVLGVLALKPFVRQKMTPSRLRRAGKIRESERATMPSEQDRWAASVDAVETIATSVSSLIHVVDSEADDYALLAKFTSENKRFLIRQCYDRRIDLDGTNRRPGLKLRDFALSQKTVCTREILVSRRGRSVSENHRRQAVRAERKAKLAFSACSTVILRPDPARKDLPARIPVNLVCVKEIRPPKDAEPIEWILLTGESIDTPEQLLLVADRYRARWVIEEYFKALKTGCAYEKRLLGSFGSLANALAIFAPIAWGIMRLRSLARSVGKQPAQKILPKSQLAILRSAKRCGLPPRPTIRDAMLAIARLGGHLARNGEPGWLVLTRGYLKLLDLDHTLRSVGEM